MCNRRLFFIALTPIIFAAAGVLVARKDAQAQKPKRLVELVDIEGNYRLRAEDIFQSLKTRPGDVYNQKTVENDLQALLELGAFDRTQTRVTTADGHRGGIVVVFTVVELPLIRDLKFVGLQDVAEGEVLEALRKNRTGIEKDGVYEPAKVKNAVSAIKQLFASRGWPNVTVEVIEDRESFKTVALTFVIAREKRY